MQTQAKVERNQKEVGGKKQNTSNQRDKQNNSNARKKIKRENSKIFERKILTWQKEQKRRIVQLGSALQRRKPPRRSTVWSNQFLRLLQIFVPAVHPSLLLLFQNFLIFLFLFLLLQRAVAFHRRGKAWSHTRDLIGVQFSN